MANVMPVFVFVSTCLCECRLLTVWELGFENNDVVHSFVDPSFNCLRELIFKTEAAVEWLKPFLILFIPQLTECADLWRTTD